MVAVTKLSAAITQGAEHVGGPPEELLSVNSEAAPQRWLQCWQHISILLPPAHLELQPIKGKQEDGRKGEGNIFICSEGTPGHWKKPSSVLQLG